MGDTQWLDMAHSVAKIFLTTDVGLAVRDVSLQIVSPEWIIQARTPGAANVDDGLCQLVRCPGIEFHVPGQRAERDLRRSAERLAGGGGWIDKGSALNDQFIGRVLAAPKN